MTEATEVAAFRVPRGTVAKLKLLAHHLSLERGKDVTWSSIMREAIEKNLSERNVAVPVPTNRSAIAHNQ